VREVAGSNPVVPTIFSSPVLSVFPRYNRCGFHTMNLIEMLFFFLAVFLSFAFGRYFLKFMGWWGVLPASILGFGIVIGIIAALNKLIPSRPRKKMQQQLGNKDKDN
jgi:hypothetical protein